MKNKTIVLICLTGVMFFALANNYNGAKAASKKKEPVEGKIGIVSIQRVFEGCKKNINYRKETEAEQDRVLRELKKLDAEIKAAQVGLKTLKTDSSEYMAQVKEILQKDGQLQAQKKFYEQQLALKDKKWTEELYQDVLRLTAEVAADKELELVLEADAPELPARTVNDLMLTIRTHKVLYSSGCVDISDEVLARMDAE